MSQRITLQYSIKLQELGAEVERLLTKAHTSIEALNKARMDSHVPLSFEMIEYIEGMRAELGSIDFLLNDITTVISGYLDYQLKLRHTSSSEMPLDPASLSQLDALTKKLEEFREDSENTTQGSSS